MISAKIIERLTEAGCDSPKREAQMLLEHSGYNELQFMDFIKRRCAREPISQIIGERGFWEHDFNVTPDVLTPRPDSEVLIEEALKLLPDKNKPYKFLDLGTGSGCLLLSLLHEYNNASGLGVDKSLEALKVAKSNMEKLELSDRADFIQGNWAQGLTDSFDLVISNPPYIPQAHIEGLMPEVRDYEPLIALEGGEDGLQFYREIMHQVPNIISKGGLLIFEVGQYQAGEVAAIVVQNGFDLLNIRKDYGGVERAVILRKG